MQKFFILLLTIVFSVFTQGQNRQYIYPLPPAPVLKSLLEQKPEGIPSFAQYLKQQLPDADIFADSQTSGSGTCSSCIACRDCDEPGCSGINLFNPYSGNVHRVIKDLEVWGGVGEEQLVWNRYGNSYPTTITGNYGEGHKWSSSYMYHLRESQNNSSGQTPLTLTSPDGSDDVFLNSGVLANVWIAQGAIDKRIIRYGSNYFLQRGNGFRYRFEKIFPAMGGGPPYYQLQDFVDSHQNQYTLSYTDKKLTRVTEPGGRFLQITYGDRNGKQLIVRVSTSDGRRVDYNYSDTISNGVALHTRLSSVQYGDGTKAHYGYNSFSDNAVAHAIDPRYEGAAANIRYTYFPVNSGVVKEEKNGVTGAVMVTLTGGSNKTVCYANGRTQVYNGGVDQYGNVNSYVNGVGAKKTYSYANSYAQIGSGIGSGFRTKMSDALGRVTNYNSKTVYGNPLKTTYPDESSEEWTRDTLDLVLTHKDELGRVTRFTRDNKHRIERIDYSDRSFETFTYNFFGQVLDHRLRNGGVEHFTYNSRGLKTEYRDALNNITTYGYDNADRLRSITDGRKNTTSYEYNERGLLTKQTNADLTFREYGYDTLGNRTTVTDELFHKWTTVYDEFRRPKTITDPKNRVTTYSYDLPGGTCGCSHNENKPTRITLPSGKVTEIEYDLEWQKIRETVGKGSRDESTTFFKYDIVGNLVRMIDPNGKTWAYVYDARNRMKSSTDPLGNKTEWMYDAAGRVLTVKRADNGMTSNVYDDLNRTIQTTDPKIQVTKTTYDTDGNMLKLLDAKNNEYNFDYDLLYRRTKMIYPNGTFEGYTYDSVSNLKTYANRAGKVRTYFYDNRNRETSSSWDDNITPAVGRTYYNNNLIKTTTSNVSALEYSYNEANELTSETQNVVGATGAKVVSYSYNTDGLRSTMTQPAGGVVSYDYTARNQVLSVKDGAITLVSYSYDANGNRINKALNNGTETSHTYDAASQMLSVDNRKAGVSLARFDYGYDNVNRRKFEQRDNDKGDTYSYDGVDQVIDVKYEGTNPDGTPVNPARTVSYTFDGVGNRTGVKDNGSNTGYSPNNLNQYTTVGINSLTYTITGSLQTFNGWTYTYDAQDRLVKAEKGGTMVQFFYDGRNRCVKRIINGSSIFLYYNGWNLIEERTAGDALVAKYVHGARMDEILIKTSTTASVFYHYNALGSVVELTNSSGSVVEKYSYDIYGGPTIKNAGGNTLQTSAFGNRFMFTGREYISEIELYDYRNRIYSSVLGRFLQTDPIRFAAGDVNLYRYVGNNAINGRDAYGLSDTEDIVIGFGNTGGDVLVEENTLLTSIVNKLIERHKSTGKKFKSLTFRAHSNGSGLNFGGDDYIYNIRPNANLSADQIEALNALRPYLSEDASIHFNQCGDSDLQSAADRAELIREIASRVGVTVTASSGTASPYWGTENGVNLSASPQGSVTVSPPGTLGLAGGLLGRFFRSINNSKNNIKGR